MGNPGTFTTIDHKSNEVKKGLLPEGQQFIHVPPTIAKTATVEKKSSPYEKIITYNAIALFWALFALLCYVAYQVIH